MSEKAVVTMAEAVQNGKRLMKEAMPGRWRLYALSIFMIIGAAVFTGALAYSTRLIVNDVFVADNAGAAIKIAVLVIFISVFKSAFEYGAAVIGVMFQRGIGADYQRLIFNKTLEKDVSYFKDRHAATQMARTKLLGQACGKTVVDVSINLFKEALTLVALFAVMLMQDPIMTLGCLLIVPLIFWIVGKLSHSVRAAANAETEMTGNVHAVGAEAFEGIKTVKSYRLEAKLREKFDMAVQKLENRLFSIAKTISATVPIMELLGGVVIGLFVIYAAWQTITHGKTPGEFTAFITAFLMAYQPAERLSKIWVSLQKTLIHVGTMFEELDTPIEQVDEGTEVLKDQAPSISFEKVSFSYEKKKRALNKVSLDINAGEWVAIVGASGAGKSTMIDLVQRFYDPNSGIVRIGGLDLRDITELSTRQNIALISQDVFLFEGSIRENILDGNPDATEEQVQDAVRRAQLGDFVEGLAKGMDTQVGLNGRALSGGQKQRVGIARALVKQAKIMIFDEATSALDAANERAIMDCLRAELPDTTMLFVTHRASTLEYMDRVLMLENGRVAGFDTHQSLSQQNPAYQKLFNLA